LPDVRRREAGVDQILVREAHRRAAEIEGRRELARRRQLRSGGDAIGLDETAKMQRQLPIHRLGGVAIRGEDDVEHEVRLA